MITAVESLKIFYLFSVAIDGSPVNSKTVDDLLSNCGNNITMTFQRFPGTFSGY